MIVTVETADDNLIVKVSGESVAVDSTVEVGMFVDTVYVVLGAIDLNITVEVELPAAASHCLKEKAIVVPVPAQLFVKVL